MTFSSCWVRKVGVPLPEDEAERWRFGMLDAPGVHYWMTCVKDWAKAKGLAYDVDEACYVLLNATSEQVADFLTHVYGPTKAVARISALEPEALYEIEADEI